MSARSETESNAVSTILETRCPLPIKRVAGLDRLWLKLQAAGLLRMSGLTSEPVTLDAYRVAEVFSKKPLFRVTLSCKGIAAGANSSTSASDAMRKAFSELCECFQVSDKAYVLGHTRNGLAAHEDENLARKCAYRELIERDSLVTHFLCPDVCAIPLTPPDEAILPVQLAELWSADATIRVVVCGLQDSGDTPWFLGAGASQNLTEAKEKAYVECVSTYCSYRHADEGACLNSQRHSEVLKHILASKTDPMRERLLAIFAGSGDRTPQCTTSIADASFQTLARLGKAVIVVSASHSCLCSLSFGPMWNCAKQETIRLLQGRGLNPTWATHPFA